MCTVDGTHTRAHLMSEAFKPLTGRLQDTPENRAGPAAISVLLHAFLIALAIFMTVREVETGTGLIGPPGTGGGGGGGEVIAYVTLPGEPPPPPPPPPVAPIIPEIDDLVIPRPVPPEPEVVVMLDSALLVPLPESPTDIGTGAGGGAPEPGRGGGPGSGGGSGGGDGGGAGTGTGGGSGPGTGGGDGTLGRPPEPRMLLFPPAAPRSVRGRSVTVHLVVDAQGVVREVALVPETGNDDLDDDIRRTALSWQFRPGTDGAGRPVTKPYEVVLTF
jgi:TonB family protein